MTDEERLVENILSAYSKLIESNFYGKEETGIQPCLIPVKIYSKTFDKTIYDAWKDSETSRDYTTLEHLLQIGGYAFIKRTFGYWGDDEKPKDYKHACVHIMGHSNLFKRIMKVAFDKCEYSGEYDKFIKDNSERVESYEQMAIHQMMLKQDDEEHNHCWSLEEPKQNRREQCQITMN